MKSDYKNFLTIIKWRPFTNKKKIIGWQIHTNEPIIRLSETLGRNGHLPNTSLLPDGMTVVLCVKLVSKEL